MEYDYTKIHRQCGWHKEAVLNSKYCGCFCCSTIFKSEKIEEWIDEPDDCPRGKGKTAVCPNCGIDSVLPESKDYELTIEFIKDMNKEFFGNHET